MVPYPVTTPSPRIFFSSSPNSVDRWVTKRSSSTKDPSSRRRSRRSLAESFPLACWAFRRLLPHPVQLPSQILEPPELFVQRHGSLPSGSGRRCRSVRGFESGQLGDPEDPATVDGQMPGGSRKVLISLHGLQELPVVSGIGRRAWRRRAAAS